MANPINLFNIKVNPYKAVSFVQSSVEKAAEKAGSLIADVKYDGVRGNILVAPASGSAWLSRVGKTIPALEHLNGFEGRWDKLLADDRWIYPQGVMLDGELLVKGVSFSKGAGLLRTKWLKKTNYQFDQQGFEPIKCDKVPFNLDTKHLEVRLYALLPLDKVQAGEDIDVMNCVMQVQCQQMVMVLREHFPEITWEIAETYDVFDMQSLNELYAEVRERGLEGLIVKDPLGTYRRGKKAGWWKLKPSEEADGVIQGVNWGTVGLSNEGKVIGFQVLLESGRLVDANNISKDLMAQFTANVKEHGEDYYNGWQAQIGYMEVTDDGSLRHPSFTCFRGTEADPRTKI